MSQPPKPRGLGRGLSALLGDDEVAATVRAGAVSGSARTRRRGPRLSARRSPCRSAS